MVSKLLNLLHADEKKDFETLTKEFNKTFQKLNDKDIKILNQTLGKIGMSFINEEITIVNREM